MFSYLTAHLGTIVVLIVIAFLMFLAIRRIVSDRRAGKHSCGGSCGNCPMGGTCEKRNHYE